MARRRRRRGGGSPKKRSVGVEGAEFFKVFIPALSSQQLLIPPDFFKNFNKSINEKVLLKNSKGKTWLVDVKKTPDGVFLQKGWQGFADYHGLKFGEFLVFQYVGSYSFLVKVFGTNGCKKEILEPKIMDTHVKSEEETDTEMEPKQTSRKHAAPQNEDGRSEQSERFGEVNEVQEEVGASEEPENSEEFENTEEVLPNYESFVSCPTRSRLNLLSIPDPVVEKHNLHLNPEMILRNAEGKTWPVKITNRLGTMYFGKGLYSFHMDNNVRLKDRYKFTFGTGRSSRTVDVQILRNTPSMPDDVRRRSTRGNENFC